MGNLVLCGEKASPPGPVHVLYSVAGTTFSSLYVRAWFLPDVVKCVECLMWVQGDKNKKQTTREHVRPPALS